LDFMRSIDKNMDTGHVLTVYNSTSYTVFEDSLRKEKTLTFRDKILRHTEFENVTASSVVPGDPIGFTYHNLTKRSLTDPDDGVPYKVLFVDYSYIPVFGLKLKAGRNYSEERGEDKNHDTLILNESAIRALGFRSAEEALGEDVYFMVTFDWKKYKIAGIVEDYRHESAKTPMLPTIFYFHDYVGQMTYYSLRVSANADPSAALKMAETAWAEVWPGKQFDYFFADQHYDQQYKSEIYFVRISIAFAAVALFLACLGIIGISLFETNARLREVGIRKVLGASVASIVSLLSRSNLRIVVLSSLVSIPFIWLMSDRWLSGYPVRINISPVLFLTPLLIVMALVMITSGFQTLKAARTNPVDYLKNE
ncbi:MAG TPA: FtsX-like permease family protein, partial [Cyclobacteriaceae bacterium]|nr:FtsX-like permease family protein [Cyclobacteriaceae bacterium]